MLPDFYKNEENGVAKVTSNIKFRKMELTQFSEFWKNYAFTFNAEQVKTAEYEKK